jgi:hypothetical protein
MDSVTREDIEFAFKAADADWQTRELVSTLLKLEECEDLREATTLAEKGLDQFKELVVERYSRIVGTMKTNAIQISREERIRMQGGI